MEVSGSSLAGPVVAPPNASAGGGADALAERLQQGLRLPASPSQPRQQPPQAPRQPRAAPSLMHDPLVKAFNPREVQVEVEPEPGAIGDRVLVRTVTIYNQSNVDLDDSLTLTAEATELWHLERVPVGALPRGQHAVLPLRLRVKSDLPKPFEDCIPESYVLTLSHASPSPGPSPSGPPSSSSRPPLVIVYRFLSSMRSFLKGLPGMAPRRLVTLEEEAEEADVSSSGGSSQSRQRRWPRPAPCNLLLIGPAGAGKSTLLAHFLTLLSDRDRVNLGGVRTCSTSEHGTLELRAYPLPNVSSVAVWDTRGITSSNYLREEIRGILEGVFPEKGLDIEHVDTAQVEAIAAQGRATRAFRRQQAVIVVIPDGLLQSRVELDHLRRQLQHVQRAGLNPLVCLTHVDLAYPILRQDPNADIPDLRESRREAARQLGVETNRVLHFVPYKDEELRRFSIDRLSYKVLATALQLAAEYVESDEPFLGAADGLIEALFHSTQRRASETTASSSTSTFLHHTLGGAGAAAAAGATAAAAGAGQGLGLDSPPPAYSDIRSSASPLLRFPPADPPTRPAGATAAAAGSTGGRAVPPDGGRHQHQQQPAAAATEDSTVVADRTTDAVEPPHVQRLASDGTEAYNSGSGAAGAGGAGGGYRGLGWEDEDGDGFDDGVSSLHGSFYSEDGTFQEPYMRGGGGGGAQASRGL